MNVIKRANVVAQAVFLLLLLFKLIKLKRLNYLNEKMSKVSLLPRSTSVLMTSEPDSDFHFASMMSQINTSREGWRKHRFEKQFCATSTDRDLLEVSKIRINEKSFGIRFGGLTMLYWTCSCFFFARSAILIEFIRRSHPSSWIESRTSSAELAATLRYHSASCFCL